MNLNNQLNEKKSNRGRPSNRTPNFKPSDSWIGDGDCKQFMEIISRNCSFHYKYNTGIKAL